METINRRRVIEEELTEQRRAERWIEREGRGGTPYLTGDNNGGIGPQEPSVQATWSSACSSFFNPSLDMDCLAPILPCHSAPPYGDCFKGPNTILFSPSKEPKRTADSSSSLFVKELVCSTTFQIKYGTVQRKRQIYNIVLRCFKTMRGTWWGFAPLHRKNVIVCLGAWGVRVRLEKHWLLALVTVSFEFLRFFLMTALFRWSAWPTPARVMTILLLRELLKLVIG